MCPDKKFLQPMIIASAIIFPVIMLLLYQVTEATIIQSSSKGFEYNDLDQRILGKFFDNEYEEGKHHEGRVYYSHSMMMYGKNDKVVEQELIRNTFNDFGMVSPKYYEGDTEEMKDDIDKLSEVIDGTKIEEMEFYKIIVSSCQILVYSKWKAEVPSGVAIEVNHAIDVGIPVFELEGDRFIPQKVHIDGMTHRETIEAYEE
jgi:hypothetical protein